MGIQEREEEREVGILERVEGKTGHRDSPIGRLPETEALDTSGLGFAPETLEQLLSVDAGAWLAEAGRTLEFLARFAGRLPPELVQEHQALVKRLSRSLRSR